MLSPTKTRFGPFSPKTIRKYFSQSPYLPQHLADLSQTITTQNLKPYRLSDHLILFTEQLTILSHSDPWLLGMGGAIITTSLFYKFLQTPLQLRLLKENSIYAKIEKKTTLQKNLSEIHKTSTKQGLKSQIYDVQLFNFFSSQGIKFTTKIYWGMCLPLYPMFLANLQNFL
jgi:hypothetical protein